MAHELEIVNGEASFAYNRKNGAPWHRLGVPMIGYGTIDEMLIAARADYEVRLQPTLAVSADGSLIEVPETFVTLRESPFTGKTEVLGTVGSRYHVIQNRELLERAIDIVGASRGDAIIDTCGVLFDGRRFFASIDLDTVVIDPLGVGDKISRNLLVYSSHDGSAQITYANTDVRAVCNNTVTFGIAGAARLFKVKHTPNADERLSEAQKALNFSTAWTDAFKEMAEEMLRIPVGQDALGRIIGNVWELPTEATDRQKSNHEERAVQIRTLFASPKNSGGYGANGWSAWNAIVEYVDHYKGGSPQKRDEAAMDDTSLATRLKAKAQEAVLTLA